MPVVSQWFEADFVLEGFIIEEEMRRPTSNVMKIVV